MKITLEETISRLRENDNFLIITHRSPDGDTLGSGFGLHFILKQLNKKSRVICEDPFPKNFSFLYENYQDEEFEPDFIITVDLADLPLLGNENIKYKEKIDLSIDHHGSNSLYAKETYLEILGANCENVYYIAKALGVKITKEIATAIYTGITTDTGCFRFSNVTSDTHKIASEMIMAGANNGEINEILFETKSLARIEIEKFVYNSIEFYFNGQVGIIHIPLSIMRKTGAKEDEIEGISGLPRQIEGVGIGVTLRETKIGHRISLRTTEEYDASKIAAHFGGGGHARAAGFFLPQNFSGAKKSILDFLERIL